MRIPGSVQFGSARLQCFLCSDAGAVIRDSVSHARRPSVSSVEQCHIYGLRERGGTDGHPRSGRSSHALACTISSCPSHRRVVQLAGATAMYLAALGDPRRSLLSRLRLHLQPEKNTMGRTRRWAHAWPWTASLPAASTSAPARLVMSEPDRPDPAGPLSQQDLPAPASPMQEPQARPLPATNAPASALSGAVCQHLRAARTSHARRCESSHGALRRARIQDLSADAACISVGAALRRTWIHKLYRHLTCRLRRLGNLQTSHGSDLRPAH